MNTSQEPKKLLSDFEAVSGKDSLRKILIIGERGIGKSSLLNKLMGYSQYKLPNEELYVSHPGAPFTIGHNLDGITKQTEYATGRLFGIDSNPEYMFIDMPGVLEDLNEDKNIQANLNDLTGKLKLLQDITGVLVLIDSEDYKNAVEMSREDYINDGVMMILIAIQVIFEEQSKEDFAMNLAFGLARCDPQTEEVWGKLQQDKVGVLEAIYNDLLENGIQVPNKNLPLFYLSSRETLGKGMVQRDEFRKMVNFFESRMDDGGQEIKMPLVVEKSPRVSLREINEEVESNLVNALYDTKRRRGDEVSITEEDLEKVEEAEDELEKVGRKIRDIQAKIEEYDREGDELRILFRYFQKESLGFFKKVFMKKEKYKGTVNIEKVENKGFTVLEGGEGSDFCMVLRPESVASDEECEITGFGYLRNFRTFNIIQEERKTTIRDLLRYKEYLLTQLSESKAALDFAE